MSIGSRLRQHRELHGLTQADVAEHVSSLGGCWTQKTVSKIEAGDRDIWGAELCLLALLGLNVCDILALPDE